MLEGRRETAELMAATIRPEAVYYSNDDLAAGGLMHCLSAGISVPSELALAGFNGLSFLEALPIRLTTVETPRLDMGVLAARHIIEADAITETPRNPICKDLGFRLIAGETC